MITSSKKRHTACHNCRTSHKKCTGGFPCKRCSAKQAACFPFQSALESSAPTSARRRKKLSPTSSSDAIEFRIAETRNGLEKLEHLYSQLQSKQVELFFKQHQITPHNEITVNLWEAPFNNKFPVFVQDMKFNIIGGNTEFKNLYNIAPDHIQRGLTVAEFLPERLRTPWMPMALWLLKSPVKHFAAVVVGTRTDGREMGVKIETRYHRNYCVTTVFPTDYLCDEFVVDDIVSPESFRVEHNNNQTICNMLVTPQSSLTKLAQILSNIKPNYMYSDEAEKQQNVIEHILDSSAVQEEHNKNPGITLPFKPVELSFDELTMVSMRLQNQQQQYPA